MKKTFQDIQKDIVGASDTIVENLNNQVISPRSFVYPFINKVTLASGQILYPFIDVVKHDDTTYVLGSIPLVKTIDTVVASLTHETIEDASPSVGMPMALSNILSIQATKKLEQELVTSIIADAGNIGFATTIDWTGIKAAIVEIGPEIYTIGGTVYVVVSLEKYLDIIGDGEYADAKKELGDKVQLVVSENLTAAQMIVFHSHGVAGGFVARPLELRPEPSKGATDYIAPYTYAMGWDAKYIKVVS